MIRGCRALLTFWLLPVAMPAFGQAPPGGRATPADGAARVESFLNINPSWSPDGKRLVFESRRHGNTELYVIDADGTSERRLTVSGPRVENTHPSWSPDGRTIVFDSNRSGVWSLYTIRPDGRGERPLTTPGASPTPNHARHPEWSPDGGLVAFDSDRDGNGELYVVRADGTGLRRLTRSPRNDSHPMWTPDGEVVVIEEVESRRRHAGLEPRTGRIRPLLDGRFYGGANIAPDGRHLVYLSTTERTPRLYVVATDGSSAPRAITPDGSTSYEAAWSRDGRHIAFYSDQTGPHEIYVVAADGSGLRQVTGVPGRGPSPPASP